MIYQGSGCGFGFWFARYHGISVYCIHVSIFQDLLTRHMEGKSRFQSVAFCWDRMFFKSPPLLHSIHTVHPTTNTHVTPQTRPIVHPVMHVLATQYIQVQELVMVHDIS